MSILGTFSFFQNLLYLIISYCMEISLGFHMLPLVIYIFVPGSTFMFFQFIEVLCKNTTLVSNILYFSISAILVNNSSFTS